MSADILRAAIYNAAEAIKKCQEAFHKVSISRTTMECKIKDSMSPVVAHIAALEREIERLQAERLEIGK